MAGAIDLILNFRANNSDAVRGIQDMISRENDLRNTLQQNIQTRQANNAAIQNDIRALQNQRSALQGNTSVVLQQRDAIDAQIRALRNHINVNNDGINVYRQQLQAVNQNTAALNQQRQALIQNDRAAEEAAQTNRKLATTFGAIAAAIGAAGLAFAKLALDASTKFSEAMGNVASVTLDSKKAVGEMSEEIKRFVNINLSATATEAAQAMYEIRSAGISAKDSMTALNDVITASKGTGADFGDTARALAGIVNAYGREIISTTEAGDIFVKTIQDGVTTGQELASTLGNITGIAAAAGVSFNEIGAAIATLTQSGIGTSEAITGLKGTISSILKPSKEAEKVFQELGIAYGGAALKSKGLSGILKEISEKTGGNIDAIGKLIPPVEALNTVLSLTKDSASKFTEELGKMGSATGAASDSASKVAEQYADAVKQLGIAFDLLKINIGESLAESLTPFINELTKLLQIFNNLDRSFIDSIVNIVKWTAIISGAVLAITGFMVKLTALPFKIIGIGKLFSSLGDGIDQLKAKFSGLSQFLDYGGKFSIAVNAAKTMIEILKKAIDAIKGSFDWLSTVTNLKINQMAVEQEQKNAQKLIAEYNKLRAAKKDISAEDLKMYSRAFAVAQVQSKSKLGKEFLQKEGIAASQLADFKAAYNERLKLANKNSNEENKINTNTTNNIKSAAKEKVKQQEDYKNDVNRIMEGLAQDEAKRTLDDLNYKVWTENKKYLEEKATLEKAIKLKQATTAQLKALEKEHQIAITNLYMDAQAEQDKIDKENKDKEKAKQKDADEKQKKDAQDLADKLNQIEEKRLSEIDQLRTQFLEKQKASTLNLASNYIESFSKLSPELGKTAKEFLGIFTNVSNATKAYDDNIKVINEKTQLTQEEAKAFDDANKALKENKGLTEEQINNNKKIIEDTKTKIQLNEKAKESLINLAKGDLEAVSKDVFVYAIGQAVEGSVNLVNVWTKYNEKLKETKTPLTDMTNMLKEQVDAIPPLLAFLKIGPALSSWLTNSFIGDKAKIEEALNKKAEIDDEISTAERKNVLSDTDFKIEMVNKEYAEKERLLKKAIEDNVASENDLIRLEKLRQAEITKIRLADIEEQKRIRLADIEEQKSIKKSISDLNDKENEKFLDDTEKRIIETNREYDEKIKKLKEYIKEGKATNDDLIELEKIRNKSIENIFKEKIIDTEKAAIQKIYDFEQEAIKKTAKKKKEAAEETIKTYDKELEKAKSTIEKIDEELKKRTKERQQSQESANLFQLKRSQIKSTLPADFERMPIDVFEIEAASQEEQLKQSFALGQISLDQLNKDLMDLAVKKNLFYERIANSLVIGTKENLDYQKKANDAYQEFASLNEQTTEKQLNQQKKLAEQEQTKYDNLKKQQLKNIDDIENAQTNALIRLENKWKTPAGSFKLSMDEAMSSVADKMDAELSNFIDRAKQAISDFKSQKIYDSGSTTSKKHYTQSELTSYENKIIAEQEKRTQQLAIENAKKQAFTQSGGMLGGLGGKSFPGFATGGIFDSNKGFGAAMLHDNEMILNPFQQKNLFNLLAAGGGGINVTINTGAVNSMADINKIASAVSQVIRTDYLRK